MGDMKTHVYRTKDYRRRPTSIPRPRMSGYAHVVQENMVNPNLLFVGTEFGLFISIDGGTHWAQFKGNLPNVAVRDISHSTARVRPDSRDPRPRRLHP